jgi:hypothetical protein
MKQLPHESFRRHLIIVINTNAFNNFMLSIIISNTLVLALQTSDPIERPFGWYFGILDTIFLAIYTLEAGLKIFAFGSIYFKSGWNIFGASLMYLTISYLLLLTCRSLDYLGFRPQTL